MNPPAEGTTGSPGGSGRGIRLAGTGIALPRKVLTNDDLAKLVDTNDEWIVQRTGIKTRHVAEPHETIRDFARPALTDALAQAGLDAKALDFLILATLTPEMSCPSSAVRLVHELGGEQAGGIDIAAACCGFVYGLNLAASLIGSGHYQTVGVVGAEVLSQALDFTDRRTCILFGDGAGAAILTACDDASKGCLYQAMRSDGGHWNDLYLPRTQADLPEAAARGETDYNGTLGTMQMNGREVFKVAVTATQSIIDETLEATGTRPEDLAMVVAHQSNARILEATRKRLKLPAEKLYINIDRYGNTSAASVPLALHELRQAGKIKSGDLVLFTAVGGGMCWASSLWRV